MPVNMRAKPYYLDDEAVQWVEDTIASMSLEEKIGQLFFNMGSSRTEEYLKMTVDKYHIGGIRYNPGTAAEVHEQNRILQENSKIPLIIACNTENGGNGACSNGTMIGAQTKIGATGDAKYAKALGKMANTEAAAIGCNLSFAPVSDIYYNWHNPVVGLRTYGNDPQRVMEMTQAYMEGAHEVPGFCCAAKHFPGDGLDDRDQHVANSVNTFSCEEWDATFGKIYANLIDNGLEAIMAGHIMLPSYTRAMNPDIKDDDIMPATLSKELLTDLLKGKMGFNGMVLTDASHMVGLTCRMKRSDMIPAAIAAGCDMFLFFNDPDEDFNTMLDAYKSGVISEARMTEALTRILGLKAHLGLNKKAKEALVPAPEVLAGALGKEEYKEMHKAISRDCITLVKYKDRDVLPITPERYKRIMIVHVKGAESGMGMLMKAMGMGGGKNPAEMLKERLCEKGFDAFIYESPLDAMKKQIAAGVYRPGDRIVETQLAREMNVSQAPVREALLELQKDGYVSFSRGKGVQVVPVSDRDARDILETRMYIECINAKLAANRAAQRDLQAMRESLDRLRDQLHQGWAAPVPPGPHLPPGSGGGHSEPPALPGVRAAPGPLSPV